MQQLCFFSGAAARNRGCKVTPSLFAIGSLLAPADDERYRGAGYMGLDAMGSDEFNWHTFSFFALSGYALRP